MSIKFIDNSDKIKAMMKDALIAGLHDAGAMIMSQTKQNSRVASGQTKNAWKYVVDEADMTATVGNPLENSLWEELGTGEFALNHDGRKGGWFYKDAEGKGHFTYGKKPMRMLNNAFVAKKNAVIRVFEKHLKDSLR